MLDRGSLFLQKLQEARGKIVRVASQSITNGAVSTEGGYLKKIKNLQFDSSTIYN